MLICTVIATRTYHTSSLNIVNAVIAAAFIVRSLAAVGDGLSGHFWWYQPPARLKWGLLHTFGVGYSSIYTWQATWWDWVPPHPQLSPLGMLYQRRQSHGSLSGDIPSQSSDKSVFAQFNDVTVSPQHA